MVHIMTSVVTLPRISILFISLLAAFLMAYPVLAQDTATTSRKEAVKERVEARKELVQARKETLVERRDALKERMATKEAALKNRLANFKDQKKATAAARINTNLNKINEKQTDMMLKHLEKMSQILTKLETRVNAGKPDIKDPASARAAIADAKIQIASATAAVNAQVDKNYTVSVTSEATVKTDAQAVRNSLHTDLKSVREAVIAAKQSVAKAIRVAKSGSTGREATNSGQQ